MLSYHASAPEEEVGRLWVSQLNRFMQCMPSCHIEQHTGNQVTVNDFLHFGPQLKNMPSVESINLQSYDFDDLPLSDDGTVLAAARMFYDCGFVDRFKINQKVRN